MKVKHAPITPGTRFGNWLAIEPSGSGRQWICRCGCGTVALVLSYHLKSGRSRSCGCGKRKAVRKRPVPKRRRFSCGGQSGTPTYRSYTAMLTRCYYEGAANYRNYGGRGIKVCDRWKESFLNFLEDMGHRPALEYSLERKDVNGDYTPENCVWATMSEQRRNTRVNRYLTVDGERKTITDWALETGLSLSCIRARLSRGYSDEAAVRTQRRGAR